MAVSSRSWPPTGTINTHPNATQAASTGGGGGGWCQPVPTGSRRTRQETTPARGTPSSVEGQQHTNSAGGRPVPSPRSHSGVHLSNRCVLSSFSAPSRVLRKWDSALERTVNTPGCPAARRLGRGQNHHGLRNHRREGARLASATQQSNPYLRLLQKPEPQTIPRNSAYEEWCLMKEGMRESGSHHGNGPEATLGDILL